MGFTNVVASASEVTLAAGTNTIGSVLVPQGQAGASSPVGNPGILSVREVSSSSAVIGIFTSSGLFTFIPALAGHQIELHELVAGGTTATPGGAALVVGGVNIFDMNVPALGGPAVNFDFNGVLLPVGVALMAEDPTGHGSTINLTYTYNV